MTKPLVGPALMFVALALFVASSAAATAHVDDPVRPAVFGPAPTPTPTVEEKCTRMLWEWIGPYWELGDTSTPPGLEYRYRQCVKPWSMFPFG